MCGETGVASVASLHTPSFYFKDLEFVKDSSAFLLGKQEQARDRAVHCMPVTMATAPHVYPV